MDVRETVAFPVSQRRTLRDVLWRWLFAPALVGFVAYYMQRAIADFGLDLHHDTIMFDAARRLINGELPFKDFFYQYNLGTVFLQGFALKTLGVQILSLKVATAGVYACIAVMILVCATNHRDGRLALAGSLVWSTLSPFYMPALNGYHAWSTVYMMAAVMGGALFLTIAVTRPPLIWALLGGVCFNLAFWFKQVAGLQILAALIWVLYYVIRKGATREDARRFRIILFGFIVGGVVSSLPFFSYLHQNSIIEDWWRSAFVFNGAFAISGHSASGLFAFVRTIFPVTRDLGYVSVIWALLPLCLVALVLERHSTDGVRLISRSDNRSCIATLFVALSFAGWLEYFPLAHAFHTHLFMAPAFVLLALSCEPLAPRLLLEDKRRLPVAFLMVVTFLSLAYETIWHLRGFRGKISAPMVTLKGETPARGLRLAPEIARSFNNFYSAMYAADVSPLGLSPVPLSVDPLHALLPGREGRQYEFKMGFNWTWPNELVEPGFNRRLLTKIAERKAPVFADSIIAVPGYTPIAVLEMPSPLSATHTFYVPSADPVVMAPTNHVISNEVLSISSQMFPNTERPSISRYDQPMKLSIMRFDGLQNIPQAEIAHLHVSVVGSRDIPLSLSKLQFERYLKVIPDTFAEDMSTLYKLGRGGYYELEWPLEKHQILIIGKFMLAYGKLFNAQNRPLHTTTLASEPGRRPFLATKAAHDLDFRILWARSLIKNHIETKQGIDSAVAYFLALPEGIIEANEESVVFAQVVFKDNTTRGFFLHYVPE